MRKLLFVILAIAGMTEMFLQASGAPVDPQVPKADRYTGDRVFLERASRLYARQGEDFQILVGDVEFRKADMFMYCDSAHFYTDNCYNKCLLHKYRLSISSPPRSLAL